MAPDSRPIPPLNLKRRFAVTSLAVIVIIALGLGWLLSKAKSRWTSCRTCSPPTTRAASF